MKKSIVSCAAAAALLLSSCAGAERKEDAALRDQYNGGVASIRYTYASAAGTWAEPRSEEDRQRLKAFQKAAENAYLCLYVDSKDSNVAILDKRSGDVRYTMMPDYDANAGTFTGMKDTVLATVRILYMQDNTQKQATNFECIHNGKFKIDTVDGGVKITYQMVVGNLSFDDLPKKISNARFQSFFVKNPALTDSDKIRIENYFEYHKDGDYWALITEEERAVDRLYDIMQRVGYADEDLKKDNAQFGYATKTSGRSFFTVPLVLALDGDSLLASVDLKSVAYNPASPPIQMVFLEYFCAQKYGSTGYFLVPDGSGALINFARNERDTGSYQKKMYGLDYPAIEDWSSVTDSGMSADMPVFGMKDADGSVFGIIEDGDALAAVTVTKAGTNSNFNSISAAFTLVESGSTVIGDGSVTSFLRIYQKQMYHGSLRVRYAFLPGADAGYNDMAQYYRGYLIHKYNLTDTETKAPYFMAQLLGGANGKSTFFGYSDRQIQPLTSFRQAQTIAEYLKGKGIQNLNLSYSGWSEGALRQRILTRVQVLSEIGGEKGLEDFLTYARANHVRVQLDAQIICISPDYGGINNNQDVALKLSQNAAVVFRSFAVLKPGLSSRIMNALASTVTEKWPETGVLLEDYGSMAQSDYNKECGFPRQVSKNLMLDTIRKNAGAVGLLMYSPVMDAAVYARAILGTPVESSNMTLFSETVPFYSLALSGLTELYAGSYNYEADKTEYLLNCMASGVYPSYEFIYEDGSVLKDGNFSYLMANSFANWKDEACASYKQVAEILGDTVGSHMTACEYVASGVTVSSYSNGVSVLVNQSESEYTYGSQTAASKSAVVLRRDSLGK